MTSDRKLDYDHSDMSILASKQRLANRTILASLLLFMVVGGTSVSMATFLFIFALNDICGGAVKMYVTACPPNALTRDVNYTRYSCIHRNTFIVF